MSFGQSSQEKATDKSIQANQTALSDLAATQEARGGKAFKLATKYGTQAGDFWKTLLQGDRSAIESFLGPELSGITSAFKGPRQGILQGARGGLSASGNTALATQEASQVGNAILGVRPQAASQLEGLSALFGNLSTGQTSQAISGLTGSAEIGFGLNKEQADIRKANQELFGQLGEVAGSVLGDIFFGSMGGSNKSPSGGFGKG